jgi:hypothetical protein
MANGNMTPGPAGFLFIAGEPPGEKKDSGDLRDFRRLKCEGTESDPTARTVDAHSKVRHEAKRESDEGQAEPDPPRPLPEMVVDKGCHGADNEANAEPDHLSLYEKIDVTVTVARERTRAEKHDDADDQHAENCQEQKIGTLAMHLYGGGGTAPTGKNVAQVARRARPLSSIFIIPSSVCWFGWDDQFLSI